MTCALSLARFVAIARPISRRTPGDQGAPAFEMKVHACSFDWGCPQSYKVHYTAPQKDWISATGDLSDHAVRCHALWMLQAFILKTRTRQPSGPEVQVGPKSASDLLSVNL